MKKIYMTVVLAVMTCIFTACEDNLTVLGLNKSMKDFIETKYPGAKIMEADREYGRIQVDILHDGRDKDVVFTKNHEWLYSEWDVRYGELPEAVTDALAKSQYADYRYDEANYIEEPNGAYYKIQLEQGICEIWVSVTEAGEIM